MSEIRIIQRDSGVLRVYRNEIKYLISMADYAYISRLLAAAFSGDAHNRSGGYLIRSLYFDSASNTDYYEKLAGIERRKKVRLRIYDTDDQSAKLEIKNRFGRYSMKESLIISRDDAAELIQCKYDVLQAYQNDVSDKAYDIMSSGVYSPKIIVEYNREAYIQPFNDIRITFDKDVRACVTDKLFSDDLSFVPLITTPRMIMEVKFNNFLPEYIQRVLSQCDVVSVSISKYCMSRELLM